MNWDVGRGKFVGICTGIGTGRGCCILIFLAAAVVSHYLS